MKDSMELMKARHSVRQYLDKKIPAEIRAQLDAYAALRNRQRIGLMTAAPAALSIEAVSTQITVPLPRFQKNRGAVLI